MLAVVLQLLVLARIAVAEVVVAQVAQVVHLLSFQVVVAIALMVMELLVMAV
jgi:hypothetical protein